MEGRDTSFPSDSTKYLYRCLLGDDSSIDAGDLHSQLNLAENELHKLDVGLAFILAKRSHLLKRISQYRASLASCNKLPYELIGEIIKLNMLKPQPFPLALGKNDPRLQITQICSHWRRAAFHVNELWSNVQLKKCECNSQARLIAAWFRQSSSVQISLKATEVPEPFIMEFPFEELVLPNSHRFVSLDIISTDVNHFSMVPFDTLKSLTVVHRSRNINNGGYMVAPLLQHLRVTNIVPHNDEELIQCLPSVPWKQLISLDLEGLFAFGGVCEILSKCELLEDLQVISKSTQSSSGNPSVSLLRLKSLQIQLGSLDLFREVFSLSTPNLTRLTIGLPPEIPEILQDLTFYSDHLSRTLRYLELRKPHPSSRLTEASIAQILHLFPFVEHLVAKECSITLGTLSLIGTKELLPRLEVLEFQLYGDRIEDIANSLVPVSSNHVSRLRDIYIHTYQRYCSGQRLQDLHDMGVNIWAVYRYPHVVGTGVGGAVGTWTLL